MEGEIASLDGRRFSLQAGIDGLDLRLGGYVMLEGDGGTKLGQVRSLEVAETDLGEMGLPGDDDAEVRTRLRIGLARGDGVILDRGIRVHSADVGGDGRLRLRFGELAPATQAALLQLDPVADREEYAELRALLVEARPESLEELATADRAELRRLGLRIANLGLERLGVWARTDAGSLLEALDDPAVRCLVVDTGSLATRAEQALVAESVLRGVWERGRERRPVLVVIDEAHNVCPASSTDVLTALATEHAVRIAGEGRKFGIYMLVATQRPQKVHENVISQCDNLVLMRLNSAADAAFIAEIFRGRHGRLRRYRLRHDHVHVPHADAVPGRDGDRVVIGPPADEPRDAVRRDHRDAGRQISKRGQVEMVVVGVRDEDGVEARLEGRDRDETAAVRDARAQHRIRQQAGAIDLDQGRGVTHVGEKAAGQRAEPLTQPADAHSASTSASRLTSWPARRTRRASTTRTFTPPPSRTSPTGPRAVNGPNTLNSDISERPYLPVRGAVPASCKACASALPDAPGRPPTRRQDHAGRTAVPHNADRGCARHRRGVRGLRRRGQAVSQADREARGPQRRPAARAHRVPPLPRRRPHARRHLHGPHQRNRGGAAHAARFRRARRHARLVARRPLDRLPAVPGGRRLLHLDGRSRERLLAQGPPAVPPPGLRRHLSGVDARGTAGRHARAGQRPDVRRLASDPGVGDRHRRPRERQAADGLRAHAMDGRAPEPQVSPDGRTFLYVRENSARSKPPLGKALFAVGANGKGNHQVASWKLGGGDHAVFSPGGAILFRSFEDDDSKQSDYWTVRPDGSRLKQLTHFKPGTLVLSASYSPDGNWIVYASDGEAGNADLYVMHADGTGGRPLTRAQPWDSAPDWSPVAN